jgi:signal transduction histidine kinase
MRLRLILSFVAVVLVSIVSFALVLRLGTVLEVRQFMYHGGMVSGDSLITELEDYFHTNGSWSGVETLLPQFGKGRGRMAGMMQDPQTGAGQRLQLADASGTIIFDSSDESTGSNLSFLDRFRAIELTANGQRAGYLLAEGGATVSQNQESLLLSRLNQAALIAALIGGGLALLLGLLLAYRLLRPVQDLTQAAGNLAAGDLTQRVAVSREDELGILGNTFNSMAASLQKSQASREALTADIAHELRTPLSVQKAYLEALEDGVYPLSVENLHPILEQNRILNRLVEDLRTLALADAGQLRLELAPANMEIIAGRVVARFQPQAESKNIQLTFDSKGQVPDQMLDAGRIEQILGNLLSNALRHTPGQGQIAVELEQQGNQLSLSIHDSGAGIPAEAMDHLFERFYRTDKSRSREAGGTGLGLTIAQQLAQAHGGSIRAANHPAGGALFVLSLPVQAVPSNT